MKKLFVLLMILTLGLTLTACFSKDDVKEEDTTVTQEEKGFSKTFKVSAPYGGPFISLAGLLKTPNLEVTALNGPQNIQTELMSGDADVVFAPVNVGRMLSSKNKNKYKLATMVTKNNAYIVTDNSLMTLESFADLKDHKVLGFAESGVPGALLKSLYQENNFDLSKIDYLKSSAEVYQNFSGELVLHDYFMMSYPEISRITNKDNFKILDLAQVSGKDFGLAGIFVKELNEDTKLFLELMEANINDLLTNTEEHAKRIVNSDRSIGAIGLKGLTESLPHMGIYFDKNPKVIVDNTLTLLGMPVSDDDFYQKF